MMACLINFLGIHMSVLTNILGVLPSLMQFATAKNNKLDELIISSPPSTKCNKDNPIAQEFCELGRKSYAHYENQNPQADYYCVSGNLGYDSDMVMKLGASYSTEENRASLKWNKYCYFERQGELLKGVCKEKNGQGDKTYYRSQMPLNEFIQTARRICSK